MRLLNFSIIKLTLCMIAGITISQHWKNTPLFFPLTATIVALTCSVILLLCNKSVQRKTLFGFLLSITMIGIGYVHHQINTTHFPNNHYLHSQPQKTRCSIQLHKRLKPSKHYHRYIAKTKAINHNDASGRLLINIDRCIQDTLNIDDILEVEALIAPINTPKNPYQFDYSKYMALHHVRHQISIRDEQFSVHNGTHTIYGFTDRLRTKIINCLSLQNLSPNTLAITSALLLGEKSDISKTLYQDYINAGAVHLLAISGLHIGILLLILDVVLAPMHHNYRYRNTKQVIILLLLWAFAILTGLSSSVVRATSMFSVFVIARVCHRKTNTINTVAISLFFLLLMNPLLLFDVGLQLSYTAVLGIVIFFPLLEKTVQPKFWITKKIWEVICLSMSAQIGLLPFSLYYFHQFSGLFLLTNILIIPWLGVLLSFGIIIIILSLSGLKIEIIVAFYNWIIELMNSLISWIGHQDSFVIKDIYFDLSMTVASYFIIICGMLLWRRTSVNNLRKLLFSIMVLQTVLIYNKHQQLNHQQLIVFHYNRYSVVGQTYRNRIVLYHDLDSHNIASIKLFEQYHIQNGNKPLRHVTPKNYYKVNNQSLLAIDNKQTYKINSITPDLILLKNNPKIHLERMIEHLNPKTIIADGSNYKSLVDTWRNTCKQQGVLFHSTYENGAYVVE